MKGFDLQPMDEGADSLACGAIALDPQNPDQIYVGSGEGGGGAYMGVGPLVSSDGGVTWKTESNEPDLAGSTFYALVVDPADSTRVVAGTKQGLYRREPDSNGGYKWMRKSSVTVAKIASVVVARTGQTTTFYAAAWGQGVYSSTDGDSWQPLTNAGFPSGTGRIGITVQPDNPNIIYALVATQCH